MNYKKNSLLIVLIFVLSSTILHGQVIAQEPPRSQANTSDMTSLVKEEVRTQIEALRESVIGEIEAKSSALMVYITIVLSIIGLAVAVWAALGIISAIDNRKVNRLEERYKHLEEKLEKEAKLHNEFLNTSKLQEKKLAILLILALPIGPRVIFRFLLDNRLDKFITYTEIDEVIKNSIPSLSKIPIFMEKLESGESRGQMLKNLNKVTPFLDYIDTGNGYIFSIKDVEYKNLYIEASKEFEQKNIKDA